MSISLSTIQDQLRGGAIKDFGLDFKELKPGHILLVGDGGLGGLGDLVYVANGLTPAIHQALPNAKITIASPLKPSLSIPHWLNFSAKHPIEEIGTDNYDFIIVYTISSEELIDKVLGSRPNAILSVPSKGWEPNTWLHKKGESIYSLPICKNMNDFLRNMPFFYSTELPERMGLPPTPSRNFFRTDPISKRKRLRALGLKITPDKLSRCILINPFSQKATKWLYPEIWDELSARHRTENHGGVIGLPGTIEAERQILIKHHRERIHKLRLLSLQELVNLITCVPILVGVDSAPSHFAAALGVPSITVFKSHYSWRNNFSYFDVPAFAFELKSTSANPFPYQEITELTGIVLSGKQGCQSLLKTPRQTYEEMGDILNQIEAISCSQGTEAIEQIKQRMHSLAGSFLLRSDSPLIRSFHSELDDINEDEYYANQFHFALRMSNYYKFIRWVYHQLS